MPNHHFISYSRQTGTEFGLNLYDDLLAGPPSVPVWLDQRQLQPASDWSMRIADAIRECESLLFVMTRDSVAEQSECAKEWTDALRYKRPIVPLLFDRSASLPMRLSKLQYIDFIGDREVALAQLRKHLRWRASEEGKLQNLRDRLAVAEYDLSREASDAQRVRIEDDIKELKRQVAEQQWIVEHPEEAKKRVEQSIERGVERERQPAQPVTGVQRTKFINPPPGIAPHYFQDRHIETGLVGKFLKDDAQRMMTIFGRGGVGKTAMVCRLLKGLERGQLPDDGAALPVNGIVYLSATGSRRVTMPNLFADLCELLPDDKAARLDALYRDPHVKTEAKMRALLAEFPTGQRSTVLLLDNFEDVVSAETFKMADAELLEALCAVLEAPPHGVKVVITTRVAPADLALVKPALQARRDLDEGLESPYAENILREMDTDGKVGLKNAPAPLLLAARERTRGYPRALEALFAILSADRDTSLDGLLADTAKMLPDNVVKDLVGEAFSRLDPAAQRVMQALAIYGRPVTPAAVDYLLQPFLAGVNSAPILGRLVNMQFARKESGRYYLHPVDLAYALSRIERGNEFDHRFDAIAFTQFALLHRAADYFQQTRSPRESWKKLDDLAPQLAEFELRCAAHDFDTAAMVLLEIDFDYLRLWGHFRLMADLHERLGGKLDDRDLEQRSVGNLATAYTSLGRVAEAIRGYEQALAIARELGDRPSEGSWLGNLASCYDDLGQTRRAIDFNEQALAIAREVGDRSSEGTWLGNLAGYYYKLGQTRRAMDFYEQALAVTREVGDRSGEGSWLAGLAVCYNDLGETRRAIDFNEQALAIAREVGDRSGEGSWLGNLATCYSALGETRRAIDFYEQALAIAREIGDRSGEGYWLHNLADTFTDEGHHSRGVEYASAAVTISAEIQEPRLGSYSGGSLARAHLLAGGLAQARSAVEAARLFDAPENNFVVGALGGVIALRQGDGRAAEQILATAVTEASRILEANPANYQALDSKALALCGLALCGETGRAVDAIETYHAARQINRDAGVVKRVLQLFDALAVLDKGGALAEVRAVAAGER